MILNVTDYSGGRTTTSKWTGWKRTEATGTGMIIDGEVKERFRHLVTDTSGVVTRFQVLVVNVRGCHRRRFDANGQETFPKVLRSKKVASGWLNIYDDELTERPDVVNVETAKAIFAPFRAEMGLGPEDPGRDIALFGMEESMRNLEFNKGDMARIKTIADAPFVQSVEHEVVPGSGPKKGDFGIADSWAGDIQKHRGLDKEDTREGVDESEWLD